MTPAIPYLLQGKNVILVIDGKSFTISKDTHVTYNKIIEALKARDWDSLRDLVDPKKAIVKFGRGFITIDNNTVFWKGKEFHNALSARMIDMLQEGFPIEPMVQFMENLMKNPSKRSIDQLYGFLEKNKLPITEDGYFLAFKKVQSNYMDIHSGTIDNSIGQTPSMDRNLVDDNPDSHCSSGLHFCSESYLSSFGNSSQPVMILKINPADVVSIPTDYNGAKGRCCAYEVVAEVSGDPASTFSSIVNQSYGKVTDSAKLSGTETVASWPFSEDDNDKNGPATQPLSTLYDLRRVNGGMVEYSNLTYDEALAQKDKNYRQKKAMLKLVEAGTTKEVE